MEDVTQVYYGKKVKLRSLELDDIDTILQLYNNLELRRTIANVLPVTKQQEVEWVKRSWENRMKGRNYMFALETFENEFLGTVGLFEVDTASRNAELGIAVYDLNQHNKGYGTDAIITICGFGFLFLNLHNIYLKYVEFNTNGPRAYEKAGFTKTGRDREMLFRDGKYHDFIRMDILNREYLEKFPEYTLYSPK